MLYFYDDENENAYKNKVYGINDEIDKRKTLKGKCILYNAKHHTRIYNFVECKLSLKLFANNLKFDWLKKPNKKNDG